MGRIFKTEKPWTAYTLTASPETDVPNFPWCSGFVVLISTLIGSLNICEKTREQKNTCTGKTEIKQCLRETLGTWQRSGYLWNKSVVVCNLAGLDKNWTDFKKKRRVASKASATGMILVHSGFSVTSWWILMLWYFGSTRQARKAKAQNFLAGDVRLCTGIADKIEVVTIAIDEKTILEIIATIALPYSDQVWQGIGL